MMYAAGGVFGVLGGLILASYAYGALVGDNSWLFTVIALVAVYWWLFPVLAVLAFIGWYIARGTSRGASLAMIIGGGLFTFAMFFLLALVNFWEPLLVAAALVYVPSIVTLALGIHSYMAPPVEIHGERVRMAIYGSIRPARRILRTSSVLSTDHQINNDERRRRVLR